MKPKNILLHLILICTLSSCSKWIDVKPTDRLSEDMLFADKTGYVRALNGVYVEMANTALYGQFMTTSALDAMAGYYYIVGSTNVYYNYCMFSYTSDNTKSGFDNAWKKAYELIINTNVIIEKCGNAPSGVLPDPYYGMVKGEALALRAMLHLDMLRLFGPIWSETNKSVVCIPYSTASTAEISPLLSADQVMAQVMTDLTDALALLKNTDPVITEGVRNAPNATGPNDFYYRQYRLNYYAVKALMARASLWKGDKVNALRLAKELIDEVQKPEKPIFPFVTFAAATSADKPDRMFSPEVIFSIYTINRKTMYDNLFAADQNKDLRLAFNAGNADKARIDEMYADKNDYRYRIWEDINVGNVAILTNQKYKDVVDGPGRYMIPLIRLSELYLIAAECSGTLIEGTTLLNKTRTSRNTVSVTPSNTDELKAAITSEYRKEMFGEGQLFYYFKRNAFQSIPNNAALTGNKTMVLNNYVVPLPDSETSLRSRSTKN
jgi:hypothetical protein